MNTQIKRRLIVVTGIIVIVLAIVVALVAGTTGYTTLSVADALEPDQREKRVQVTGNVVNDSYTLEDDVLTFSIYDTEGDPKKHLTVEYSGGVSATFGNQVTAICTGTLNAEGILVCSELVTKCPSKYETGVDALGVSQLLDYGDSIVGNPLKVTGVVKPSSIANVTEDIRLVLVDEASDAELPIAFSDALSDEISDNSLLVITGALNKDGVFEATDIALKED